MKCDPVSSAVLVFASGACALACTVWNGVALPISTDAGPTDAADAAMPDRYPREVVADGPLAYWRAERSTSGSSRTVPDATGRAPACTLSSNATVTDGALRGARSVHVGIGDSIECSSAASDDFAFPRRAPFTIEAFVALDPNGPRESAEYRHILDRTSGGDGASRLGYAIFLHRTANEDTWELALENWRGDGTLDYVNARLSPAASSGAWFHLVLTRDGSGRFSLYVDGEHRDGRASVDAPPAIGVRMIVGQNQNRSCCSLRGAIGELAVFGKALSAADVKRHVDSARIDGFVPR